VLRVVADTNIFISALNFGGTCDEVLSLARRNRIAMFVSPPILEEIEGVLRRKFGWSAAKTREALAAIRAFTRLVAPQRPIHVIKEDDPDNRILECALEARATTVVTGDGHLRRLHRYRGIEIQSPSEFLESRPWLD
jgi:putative PIN family toxin of toxin-antitoxin system